MQPETIPSLKLSLLGPFQAILNDQPVTEFRADSARGLLAYLAMRPGTDFRRETLAALLWPERSQEDALVNLRQILTILRRALDDQQAVNPFLLVTAQTIQFNSSSNFWLDVTAYTQRVPSPSSNALNYRVNIRGIKQAVELYRGEFLNGFALDSEPFDEWLVVQREHFHRQVMDMLARLTTFHERRREFEMVAEYAQKQIELEPWCEEAHRHLMLSYSQTGQRSAALVQYARCQRAFAEAFSMEPSPTTTELYRTIAQADVANKPLPHSPSLFNNLPAQTTPLIGREELVSQIEARLLSSNLRLVTLLGPGGVGKTRLAVVAADHLRGCFADGVCYVSFAELESRVSTSPHGGDTAVRSDPITVKLSNVFRLVQSDTQSQRTLLLDYLRSKDMLLILDDLEMIRDAAAEFIAEVLRQAPNLILLTTSRQPLGLVAESVVRIPGLSVPTHSDPAAAEADSVRLFIERARRAAPEFLPSPETIPDIIGVCQLVDGLPLGIELAAVWTKYRSVAEIARMLETSPERIGTTARDLPERHRSLRAVFDRSWLLLSAEERSTLSQATVFCGGFDLDAARAVIAGDWSIEDALNGLLDHSLMQRDASGRYCLHSPIEKFANEKIADPQHGDDAENSAVNPSSLQARHTKYYLDWVTRSENSLDGRDVRRGLESFRREWENIQRAWAWAVEHAQSDLIAKCLDELTAWLVFQGRFQEGEELVNKEAQHLREDLRPVESSAHASAIKGSERIETKRLLCHLLVSQAQFLSGANGYADALAKIDEAQILASELQDLSLQAAVSLHRGSALHGMGDYALAQSELELAVTHARAIFDQPSYSKNPRPTMSDTARRLVARGLESASLVAWSRENFQAAREYASSALTLFRDLGNYRDEMQVHMAQGLIAASGAHDLQQARKHFTDALVRARETGNYFHETIAKKNLGYVALALGQTNEARTYLENALQTYREFGDRPMQAETLCHLGFLLHLNGENQNAFEYGNEAVNLAHQFGEPFHKAVALTSLAHAQLGLGNFAEARAAYQSALELHEKLGQTTTALTPRAGIVQTALKSGQAEELAAARPLVGCIVEQLHLESAINHPTLGVTALYDPFWLYLTCIQSFQIENDPRAKDVLRVAHSRLHACAEKISDGELRMSFLENIPTHQAITRMWKKAAKQSN